MSAIFTLQYGTYTFPNQTFLIQDQSIVPDTPTYDVGRTDGGVNLQGFLGPKKFPINGKIYSSDKGTTRNDLLNLMKSMHNGGAAASFQYSLDRNVPSVRLAQEGIRAQVKEPGLYEYMYDVALVMIADRPFAQGLTGYTINGTRNNASALETLTNNGNYPSNPIFTFVAGASFTNNLRVDSNANSMFFGYSGPMLNGQTLVVDCDAGCVLLQVGLTMTDATSYFFGNLFFRLEPGGANTIVVNGGTLTYQITNFDRWYI